VIEGVLVVDAFGRTIEYKKCLCVFSQHGEDSVSPNLTGGRELHAEIGVCGVKGDLGIKWEICGLKHGVEQLGTQQATSTQDHETLVMVRTAVSSLGRVVMCWYSTVKRRRDCWRVFWSYIGRTITESERMDMATDSRWIEMDSGEGLKGDPFAFSWPPDIPRQNLSMGVAVGSSLVEGCPRYGAAFLRRVLERILHYCRRSRSDWPESS
jgi:hypothetical protein